MKTPKSHSHQLNVRIAVMGYVLLDEPCIRRQRPQVAKDSDIGGQPRRIGLPGQISGYRQMIEPGFAKATAVVVAGAEKQEPVFHRRSHMDIKDSSTG
ncbi:MAG: hypothetical protein QG599_3420 [Pseudomonadota bacterium]|nr:hypothetical protein [Pseudomonadota bacterium]